MKKAIGAFMLLGFLVCASQAWSDDVAVKLQQLEDAIKKQEETIRAQQRMIDELKSQMTKNNQPAAQKAAEPEKKMETAAVQTKEASPLPSMGSVMTNPYISVVLNSYAYTSRLSDEELAGRGIAGYTHLGLERKNGFNLEAAELFIYAPVDPFFNLYVTVPVTEEGAELEEAYFVTTFLPKGHQVKGGKFKSGFGRMNALHPHAWDFVDAPLAYRAFTGDEGIIEKGVQYTYLPPLPFYLMLGVEALQGENELLFGSDAAAGAHAFSAFAKASFDLGDSSTLLIGASAITGKTQTESVTADSVLSGDSTLAGLELTWKWRPSKDLGLKFQGEYLYRTQFGALEDTVGGTTVRLDRYQDGLYAQGVLLWTRFEIGARYDTLGLFKNDYLIDGIRQDAGRKPWRASGMAGYKFSEFALMRLQYNHDESDISGKVNDELFLQAVFSIGAHGAHAF